MRAKGVSNVGVNSPLFEQAELSDTDFQKTSRLIYDKCRICLSEGKEALVKSGPGKKIREGQFGSFRNYYQHVVPLELISREIITMTNSLPG